MTRQGWRYWNLTSGRLHPISPEADRNAWTRAKTVARCPRPHPSPAIGCACGIYAFAEAIHVASALAAKAKGKLQADTPFPHIAIGQVTVSGPVLPDVEAPELSFRGSSASLTRLYVQRISLPLVPALGRRYPGVEVTPSVSNGVRWLAEIVCPAPAPTHADG